MDVFLLGKAKNKPQYEQLDKTDSDQSETSKYTHNKYMIKLKWCNKLLSSKLSIDQAKWPTIRLCGSHRCEPGSRANGEPKSLIGGLFKMPTTKVKAQYLSLWWTREVGSVSWAWNEILSSAVQWISNLSPKIN